MKRRILTTPAAFVFLFCFLAHPWSSAILRSAEFEFTVVAKSFAPASNGGTYNAMLEPTIDDGVVAFGGGTTAIPGGGINTVYVGNVGGSPAAAVEVGDPIPDGAGLTFGGFGNIPIVERRADGQVEVAFSTAADEDHFFQGLYRAIVNGAVSVIANPDTPIPFGSGNFGLAGFSGKPLSLAEGQVVFGWAAGIYRHDGSQLHRIEDSSTKPRPIPPHGHTFFNIFDPHTDGVRTTFLAGLSDGLTSGIYKHDGSVSRLIAQAGATIPGDPGTFFGSPHDPTIDGDDVVFSSTLSGASDWGVFRHNGSQLMTLAKAGDAVPEGGDTFFSFEDAAVDRRRYVFESGLNSGGSGLYTNLGGSLTRLVGTGDTIGAMTVDHVFISRDAISRDQVAFLVFDTDLSSSVVVATLKSGFRTWTSGHSLVGPAALPESDGDGDDLVLLVEFCFNLDPGQSDHHRHYDPLVVPGPAGPVGLPNAEIIRESNGSTRRLELKFIRRRGDSAAGFTYSPQFSSDLGSSWSSSSMPEAVQTIDLNWEEVTVRDDVSVAGGTRRFARVLVSLE